MKAFHFWQKWLLVASLLIVIFGLALAFFNQAAMFDSLLNNQINPAFWGSTEAPGQVIAFQRWIYGVLGATVAGWGVCMTFIARYPFWKRERWAWNCIAAGVIVWFVVDTGLSLYYAPFNAAFNAVLFLVIGLPLAFTRKDMA